MTNITYFGLASQMLVFAISLFFYVKYKSNFLFLLSLLFFTAIVVEGVGAYFLILKKSSYYYHYIFVIVEFLIISLIYYKLTEDKKRRMFFVYLIVLFCFFWMAIFFDYKLYRYLLVVEGTIISLYVFLYLRDVLLSNKILNYKKLLPFWISVGFLVFYLPSIPFFAFLKYMKGRELFYVLSYLVIFKSFVVIYGLIMSNKKEM